MKTVTGRVMTAEPISLSKAATLLSGFASSENGATQAVSAYLRRASAAFTELKSIHREIKSSSGKQTKPRSDRSEDVSIYGREQDEVKEGSKKTKKKQKKVEVFVDEKVKEKLEDEQRNEERKNKKRKSNGEMDSEEMKSKKKRKSKEIDD